MKVTKEGQAFKGEEYDIKGNLACKQLIRKCNAGKKYF